MIRPSRRRNPDSRDVPELVLHRQLARSHDLTRRLTAASVAALGAALLLWPTGLGLELRALIVLSAAIVATLLRGSSGDTWALAWIRGRSGLAYQTALEWENTSDRYGFRKAIEERARRSAAALDRPQRSAWWLPITVLALGILLLPSLSLPTGSGNVGGGPAPPGGTPQAPADEPAGEEAERQPELEEEQSTARLDGGGELGASSEEPTRGEAGEGGQGSEDDALDRFLENARQRSEEQAGAQDEAPGSDGSPVPSPPREGANEQAGEPEGRGTEEARGDESRDGESRQGEQDGEGQGEERAAQAEQGEGEEGEGEEGETTNPFEQATGGDPGEQTGEDGEEAPAEGEGEGDEGEALTEEDGGESGGRQAGEGEDDAAREGDGAGALGAAEQPAGLAESRAEDELRLQGELGEGQVSSGGEVQLPGSDEVDLPEGTDPGSYGREVERAVSEGRIPLEYQEVIRNYFR